MNKKSLALAVAGVFLFSMSARASAPAAPAADVTNVAAVTDSEIGKVYAAAAKELSVLDAREPDINKRIAAYQKFSYSAELKPRLKAIFGTDKPFALERLADSKGRHRYQSVLKAGSHTEEQAHVAWSDVTLRTDTNFAGNQMNYSGDVKSLSMGVASKAQVSDITIDGRQTRAANGLWYGSVNMGVASISVTAAGASDNGFLLQDMRLKTDIQQRGKVTDLAYGLAIKSAGMGDNTVERINIATRVRGMDSAAVSDFIQFVSSPQLQQLAPDAGVQIMMRKGKELGKSLLKAGLEIIIDDISAAWRGQVASLKGRIGFAPSTDADLDSLPALLKKLTVRLELRVPVLFVQEYARITASKSLDRNAPDYAANVAAAQKQIADKMVGDIAKTGFVAVDQDALRTLVEFKNGVLTLNGKAPSMLGMRDGKLALPAAAVHPTQTPADSSDPLTFVTDAPLVIDKAVLERLAAFRRMEKFGDLPGTDTRVERARLTAVINRLTDRLVAGVESHPSKRWVLAEFQRSLKLVAQEDTEAREQFGTALEALMDIVGIESSDGLLSAYLGGL